ncbi:MAG: aminomethyl-transferring glycine dehydrogenase [Bradymonadia bacterium]
MSYQLDELLRSADAFLPRHLSLTTADREVMLAACGAQSQSALVEQTVPSSILLSSELALEAPQGERVILERMRAYAQKNRVMVSMIGQGYSDTITPPVLLRNILENPGWYTQYTPYQAEISQGRLEALINFQTVIADLTGLPMANSSLLDEGTAAAEAMSMSYGVARRKRNVFFVSEKCHPQTIAVLETRAVPMGIEIEIGDASAVEWGVKPYFGALIQYPDTSGEIVDYRAFCASAQENKVLVTCACDLMALTLLEAPGAFGADIAIGNSQRFGVPLGAGGPHAGFLSTRDDFRRQMPGRIIGVSKDVDDRPAYRLTLQTREQHIRRDRATSNICTAQVLLAIMAGMYAVYHGPEGLKRIASRILGLTTCLRKALEQGGYEIENAHHFDTLKVKTDTVDAVLAEAQAASINLRRFDDQYIGISLDEMTTVDDLKRLAEVFGLDVNTLDYTQPITVPKGFARETEYLTHEVFHRYQSEHEMLRYLNRLQQRDLSLTTSMIPLGSCTMKLNSTSEMLPITWPEFGRIHPFAPSDQRQGYLELCEDLENVLAEITGFAAVSLQPNAGSQGEYAGLLTIRAYHMQRGDTERNVCLIPTSAHGTNPASAVMAGMKVVPVRCNDRGDIDVADLKARAETHREHLSALMVTYPSTHGVFEASIKEVCQIVHDNGGLVYMDGANMNAQVGLCRPGDMGADVCHLNLHKTFCIPHGGGGPGMGPIAVNHKLAPFLPGHPEESVGGEHAIGPVSAAPFGSPSILPIPLSYILMMGGSGLKQASMDAILSANYMTARLAEHYEILYRGESGRVAHEFIIDCRPFKADADVSVDDIAKRLMDYGFHAPTMSWPVAGTLMIEPTESESKAELDRFCDAMISIRREIDSIQKGVYPKDDNPLRNAPHTARQVAASEWSHPYTREEAVYPANWLKQSKYWPPVRRVDNAFGDRNPMCLCPPMSAFEE